MRRFLTYSFCALVFCIASVVYAVGDDFTISTTIVDPDVTPPSVPANLTATPVALSQIDLAWDASTDNIAVSGYQVFRDGTQIATSGAITYSDTGLTPSTTYAYYVTAFDASGNFSASSTVVATTTLASSTPPVATTTASTTPGAGGAPKIELQNPPIEILKLEVIPDRTSAVLRYETKGVARTIVRWGKTTSYELGSLAEGYFTKIHETRITDLDPSTTYRYIIEGENKIGEFGVLTVGTFTTLPPEDILPPGNVMNLRATADGDDVVLTWINPRDQDFDRVRILRNDNFYPGDIADGWLVYEDDGESARDRNIVAPNTRQFYTVFSYDELGNISSGAVVAIEFQSSGSGIPVEIMNPELNPIELEFNDLEFIQDDTLLPVQDSTVEIDGTKKLHIRIPYDRVPEHLKTILVTLEHPEDSDSVFSFLLRINAEKTAYESFIAPLGVSGTFPLRVSVFDFKTSQIGYADGTVHSTILYRETVESESGFVPMIRSVITYLSNGYFVLFILFLLLLLILAAKLIQYEKKRKARMYL